MRTTDRISVRAPLDRVFALASGVERWPTFLPHYRWVRVVERTGTGTVVDMAAWRPFGPLRYPTWWVSQMEILPDAHAIRYRHIRGVTRGMDVEWRVRPESGDAGRVEITIEHLWSGPAWPLIGRVAAAAVIGPIFIHHIASLTLAGMKREAERV